MIYYFLFGGIALICGLFFFPFGGLKYLQGIRALSEKERKNIRMRALSVNIAAALYALSAVFILSGAVEYFQSNLSKWFLVAWFIIAAADALFISRSGYYFKDKGDKR